MANHTVVIAQHSRRDGRDWHDIAWADLGILDLNAVTKEEFVHFFDLFTGTKDALMTPVVL